MSQEQVTFAHMPIGKIDSAHIRFHPFNLEAQKELEASIEQVGILEPILIRPKHERFEVICGQSRLDAAKALLMKNIPCIIRPMTDVEAKLTSLIENIQRSSDVDPIIEGKLFSELMTDEKLKIDDIAKRIGKSYGYVSLRVDVSKKLHPKLQSQLSKGEITLEMGHVISKEPLSSQVPSTKRLKKQKAALTETHTKRENTSMSEHKLVCQNCGEDIEEVEDSKVQRENGRVVYFHKDTKCPVVVLSPEFASVLGFLSLRCVRCNLTLPLGIDKCERCGSSNNVQLTVRKTNKGTLLDAINRFSRILSEAN